MRGVKVQDFFLVATGFQQESVAGLDYLFVKGTVAVTPCDPCQLHGDRATSANDLATAQVGPHSTDDGYRVYPGMQVKAFVLVCQQAGDEFVWEAVRWRKTPLSVRCDPCPQELPFGRIKQGGTGLRKECPWADQV